MAKTNVIYLHVWSGNAEQARACVALHYPGAAIRDFPHRKLRESSLRGRIRLLRQVRGRAIVFYVPTLSDFKYGLMVQSIHLLHHCHETVLCDSTGQWRPIHTAELMRALPGMLCSLLRDLAALGVWWIYLRLGFARLSPVPLPAANAPEHIAYLVATTSPIGRSGGAISHIRGFLNALAPSGKSCRVFTGVPLEQSAFPNEVIPPRNRPYFFWQAAALAYNLAFAAGVEKKLASNAPQVFYQRHTRFSIAGALLSRRMRVPLILEYNGPEVWVAKYWDPSPFRSLIALCEQVTLRSAARIVVVSAALKAGLVERGFAPDRICVNPNGVDADYFCPGPARTAARLELGMQTGEVLVGFVGSFSLWHGIGVLQQAIALLLSGPQPCRLRFVLIGEGLLHGEMRSALAPWQASGQVIFTGALPPARVVACLDAADILVSPHIPMPDGSRFFGSPTKIFEYMAMGKAIVASRLEQLEEVLTHEQTAWLVTPGSVQELAQAIALLALDADKREALGSAARRTAREKHSWKHNVAAALAWESGSMESPTVREAAIM